MNIGYYEVIHLPHNIQFSWMEKTNLRNIGQNRPPEGLGAYTFKT